MICPHPCNFRLRRFFDRGWGEAAFEYEWEGTGDRPASDLDHCRIYELTRYDGNAGRYEESWYYPPDPPFAGWRFRDPTDGRTAPVGLECFPASQGRAWDRHKIGGRISLDTHHQDTKTPGRREEYRPREAGVVAEETRYPAEYVIVARQEYRFFCERCGADEAVPGPEGGPHEIVRSLRLREPGGGIWRYSITKHGCGAWMDVGPQGFVTDSLGLDYGPW